MLKKILVPVDDSAPSTAAVNKAVELAECSQATIVLMTVVEPSTTWVAGPFGAVAEILEDDSRVEHRAHDRLLRLAAELIPDGIAFMTVMTDGDPAKQIVRQLDQGGYDLVVLGTRGLGSLKSALVGGVSRRILERSETPALVIRATQQDRSLSETVAKLAATAA